MHINIYYRNNKTTRGISNSFDYSFKDLTWDPSGKYIIADADYLGSHSVFSLPVDGTTIKEIIHPKSNSKIKFVSTTGFLLRNSMMAPTDIWKFKFNNSAEDLKQITDENKNIMSSLDIVKPDIYYFYGSMHEAVHLWFLKPVGLNVSKSWPLVQLIHGGPQGMWTDNWGYRWNPQLWTSRGYAVAMINFHGSFGFGQQFTDSVNFNWGSHPFIDIMNGTDFLIRKFKWINSTKISACGASFGGYMINWILGNTNRFTCLVCHDGKIDTRASYFSTDELYFPEWEFKGTPWSNNDLYEKWNPINLVKNWETPTLIIHGGRDYRVDLAQGISTFTALQRKRVDSELLYFPLETHFVSKQRNSIKWYNTVLGWLDRYNKF